MSSVMRLHTKLTHPFKQIHTHLTRSIQHKLLHVFSDEAARKRDVDGSLHFVACQHPQLNVGSRQQLDALRHTLLQFVLDGCAPVLVSYVYR